MSTQYSIEIVAHDQQGVNVERVLAQESNLDAARALYSFCTQQFPNQLIVLADRALVLARSDCP